MITELTQEQKDAMPRYVEKWIKIGNNTDRLNYDETAEICENVETQLLNRNKAMPVVIIDNPLDAWIACHYAMEGVSPNELKDRVKNFHTMEVKDITRETFTLPYLAGSFNANLFSFYDYMRNELKLDYGTVTEKYNIWESTSKIGLIYPMDNACIVSEKPTIINMNENNICHADGRSAIEYAGMEPIYVLNGIIVPEWLALTPSHEIPLEEYNSLTNAETKMEFVRKVGIERMLSMGKRIDGYEKYKDEWFTKSEYELWDMHTLYPTISYAPHLKMLNQTTKVWHVEAVSPNCRTLSDAIAERFGGRNLKIKHIA